MSIASAAGPKTGPAWQICRLVQTLLPPAIPFTLVVARVIAAHRARDLETTQEALCPVCRRPLPQDGSPCPYCGGSPGGLHVRPLFLAVVLVISIVFGAVTVFAARFYRSKQL